MQTVVVGTEHLRVAACDLRPSGAECLPPVCAVIWLLKHHAQEYDFGREWLWTHKDVRAAFKAKYPNVTDDNRRSSATSPTMRAGRERNSDRRLWLVLRLYQLEGALG